MDQDYEPQPEARLVDAQVYKARVAHCCSICDGKITPGQYYHRAVYFNDGANFEEPEPGKWPFVVIKHHLDSYQCSEERKLVFEQAENARIASEKAEAEYWQRRNRELKEEAKLLEKSWKEFEDPFEGE